MENSRLDRQNLTFPRHCPYLRPALLQFSNLLGQLLGTRLVWEAQMGWPLAQSTPRLGWELDESWEKAQEEISRGLPEGGEGRGSLVGKGWDGEQRRSEGGLSAG